VALASAEVAARETKILRNALTRIEDDEGPSPDKVP
jgi:hypothetical protein